MKRALGYVESTSLHLHAKGDPAIPNHNDVIVRLPGTRQAFTHLSIVPKLQDNATIDNNTKLILFQPCHVKSLFMPLSFGTLQILQKEHLGISRQRLIQPYLITMMSW